MFEQKVTVEVATPEEGREIFLNAIARGADYDELRMLAPFSPELWDEYADTHVPPPDTCFPHPGSEK